MASTVQDIGLSIKRLQARHHRNLDAALAPLRISLVQWDALRHLDRQPEASLHDLARLTFQTDQSIGTLAGRMIDRGLIERVPGPGRAVRHTITKQGRRVLKDAHDIVDRVLTDSLSPLSAQQLATLQDLLTRLLQPDLDRPAAQKKPPP